MSIQTITDSGQSLTEKDIGKLERKLGASLPEAYKRFMLENNGGWPEPRYFRDNVLDCFLSWKATPGTYDLWSHVKRMRKELPADVIPIACTAFGNLICLALSGENRERVYSWDHEGRPSRQALSAAMPELAPSDGNQSDDWPGYPDLTLIAENFAAFLDSFHADDDDDG